MVWIRKYRLWAVLVAVVVIVIIASRPMYWLGATSLGWVMFWLVVSVGVLATYAWLSTKTESRVKGFIASSLFVILIVGIIAAGFILSFSAPELSAYEVKAIMNYRWTEARATSAEYRGGGIWRVKMIDGYGVRYLDYNERTGKAHGVR